MKLCLAAKTHTYLHIITHTHTRAHTQAHSVTLVQMCAWFPLLHCGPVCSHLPSDV